MTTPATDPWLLGSLHPLIVGASANAPQTQRLFWILVGVCGATTAVLTGLAVVFIVRFRAGSGAARGRPPTGVTWLEATWIVTPIVLFVGWFVLAAQAYVGEVTVPAGAMRIRVEAKQWMWKLQHANGHREIDELHIPVGRPIVLEMASQDVIHSFFVPAFRLKQDVVPGRYTRLTFTADHVGEFRLLCAEYCGSQHSAMTGRVVVMTPEDFQHWVGQGVAATDDPRRQGQALYRNMGCSSCHESQGRWAPSLAGLHGSRVKLQNGQTVLADDDYFRASILTPARQVVAGYTATMPSYSGRIDEADLASLLAYLRSLPGGVSPADAAPVEGGQR